MKITLSQNEIEQAVLDHMSSIISIKEGKTMTCEFTTTRSPFSIFAEISIVDKQAAAPETFIKPEPQKEEASVQETGNNSVHSLFGNLS